MDSRARECENPAYFVILSQNCDLGAPAIPQSTEKWRIFVSFVRVVVLFSTILVVNFRSFPLISAHTNCRECPGRYGRDEGGSGGSGFVSLLMLNRI